MTGGPGEWLPTIPPDVLADLETLAGDLRDETARTGSLALAGMFARLAVTLEPYLARRDRDARCAYP